MEDYKDLKKWEWDYGPPDSIPALDLLEEELRKGASIIPIDDEHYNWKLETGKRRRRNNLSRRIDSGLDC